MDPIQFLEVRRCFNETRSNLPASARIMFDEFAILCVLHGNKGLSATQIAQAQGISCPTMTHRGDRLSSLGYISRERSGDDKRRLKCALTRKGTLFVRRTVRELAERASDEAKLKGLEPAEVAEIVARAGSLPMSADLLTLLCFAAADVASMPVMGIVGATALLQPTVSMAVLRLEEKGCIERPQDAQEGARRPMRRGSGCVLTEEGRRRSAELAELVRAL